MARFETFYPSRFFQKIYARWVIVVLIAFWIAFVVYTLVVFKSWFARVFWLALAVYQLIGLVYMLVNRDRLRKEAIPSVPPEVFLKQVKKELRQKKKRTA